MTGAHPKIWPLKCHLCGDRVNVELDAEIEEGTTGTETCSRGHELIYGYDGTTVMLLDEWHVLVFPEEMREVSAKLDAAK